MTNATRSGERLFANTGTSSTPYMSTPRYNVTEIQFAIPVNSKVFNPNNMSIFVRMLGDHFGRVFNAKKGEHRSEDGYSDALILTDVQRVIGLNKLVVFGVHKHDPVAEVEIFFTEGQSGPWNRAARPESLIIRLSIRKNVDTNSARLIGSALAALSSPYAQSFSSYTPDITIPKDIEAAIKLVNETAEQVKDELTRMTREDLKAFLKAESPQALLRVEPPAKEAEAKGPEPGLVSGPMGDTATLPWNPGLFIRSPISSEEDVFFGYGLTKPGREILALLRGALRVRVSIPRGQPASS